MVAARLGIEPWTSCSENQELNHYTTTAPIMVRERAYHKEYTENMKAPRDIFVMANVSACPCNQFGQGPTTGPWTPLSQLAKKASLAKWEYGPTFCTYPKLASKRPQGHMEASFVDHIQALEERVV